MRGSERRNKLNRKRILFIIGLLTIVYFIWIGYLRKYNTFVVISDYVQDKNNYDVEIIIDNKSKIIDTVNLEEYSWPGKIHPIQVNSGIHKIIAKSNSLDMIDSSKFFSIGYSHFYIEFVKDTFDQSQHILIDKRFGRKIIFE